jgi:hypothetical protein
MSWRKTIRTWAVTGGRKVQRVAVQGYQRAAQAGRVAAHRVLGVQKAARLPENMMRQSAMSVAVRPPERESDAAWRSGYMEMAGRRLAPTADREAGQ